MTTKFIADSESRLDKFLADMLQQTRNQVENAIKASLVYVNGKVQTKTGLKIKAGDEVEFHEPQTTKQESYEVNFEIDILYEDDFLMVLNKPYDLTVHSAPSVKEATLVDWLKSKNISLSTLSGEERHGIVHRLDKGTSGAIVIAKTNFAHQELSRQLEDKSMGRYYLALIDTPLKENCVVSKPIGRNPNDRLKMAITKDGREAKTAFFKIATSANEKFELIATKLYTGRTHQIRVHLNSLHRHIINDSLYGFKGADDKIGRFFLHAYCIYFEHPNTKETMYFVAPLKLDMQNFIQTYFNSENIYEKIDKNYIINSFNSVSEWLQHSAKN